MLQCPTGNLKVYIFLPILKTWWIVELCRYKISFFCVKYKSFYSFGINENNSIEIKYCSLSLIVHNKFLNFKKCFHGFFSFIISWLKTLDLSIDNVKKELNLEYLIDKRHLKTVIKMSCTWSSNTDSMINSYF